MDLATLTPFAFVLLAFATWRTANMIAREKGPFHSFEKLRARAPLGGLTACIYCVSVWVAVLLLIIYLIAPVLIWPLAISGAALMLRSYTGVGHDV